MPSRPLSFLTPSFSLIELACSLHCLVTSRVPGTAGGSLEALQPRKERSPFTPHPLKPVPFLLQPHAVSHEASRGRSSICPTLLPALPCPSAPPPGSALAAPSSSKPVCALPPPCLPGRAGGLPLAPPGGPGLPGHSTELGSSQLNCPCLTLNSPGPRAGVLHSSWGGYRTILSAAEKPIYFVPWIVRTGWFLFPKYHISSVPPKHCFHIFTSLKLGWHVPA